MNRSGKRNEASPAFSKFVKQSTEDPYDHFSSTAWEQSENHDLAEPSISMQGSGAYLLQGRSLIKDINRRQSNTAAVGNESSIRSSQRCHRKGNTYNGINQKIGLNNKLSRSKSPSNQVENI